MRRARNFPFCAAAAAAAESEDAIVERGIQMLERKQVFDGDTNLANIFYAKLRNPDSQPYEMPRRNAAAMRRRLVMLMYVESDRAVDDPALQLPQQLQRFNASDYPGFTLSAVDNDEWRVQRYQLTGLCYLHAPTVMLHYALRRAVTKGIQTQLQGHCFPFRLSEAVAQPSLSNSRASTQTWWTSPSTS